MASNNAFDEVIDKLELDETIEDDRPKVSDGIQEHKSSDDHDSDIKQDYIDVRNSIKQNIELITNVSKRLQESIDNCTDERYLARRVEALSQLLRTQMDLEKELFVLHKNKQTLLKSDLDEAKGRNNLNMKEILNVVKKANDGELW